VTQTRARLEVAPVPSVRSQRNDFTGANRSSAAVAFVYGWGQLPLEEAVARNGNVINSDKAGVFHIKLRSGRRSQGFPGLVGIQIVHVTLNGRTGSLVAYNRAIAGEVEAHDVQEINEIIVHRHPVPILPDRL